MNSIDKLAEIFQSFPGIGKRQARRFVYFLLHKNKTYIDELIHEIQKIKQEINQCQDCYRFYPRDAFPLCPLCRDANKTKQLMIVEKDADLENIDKTKIYEGKYFVLGGHIASHERKRSYARTDELLAYLERKGADIEEIIFGLSMSPQSEHTRLRLLSILKEKYPNITFSTLGRGLSSGTELEYSDSETLKYAIKSRIS